MYVLAIIIIKVVKHKSSELCLTTFINIINDGFVTSRNIWLIILNNADLCMSELRQSVVTINAH